MTFQILTILFLFAFTNLYGAKLPKWITDTDEYCGEKYLCAVGEGAGLMMAEASARNNLAKIFKTHVSSKESYEISSETQSDGDDPSQALVDESSAKKLAEKTELELEAVYIKVKHMADEGAYALAVLPKSKALKMLKEKLDLVDDSILTYKKSGKRSALYMALRKYELRNEMNQKYQVLSGRSYPPPIAKRQIQSLIQKKKVQGTTLFLDFKASEGLKKLRKDLINEFLKLGYKVVILSNMKHDFKIIANLEREKEYLNVKGFEKYKYVFNLQAQSPGGAKIGGASLENIQMARSMAQADRKSYKELMKKLPEKLEEFEID